MVRGKFLSDYSNKSSLVRFTSQDINYYNNLISGKLKINPKQGVYFESKLGDFKIKKVGPIEAYFKTRKIEDNHTPKGVIGLVARINNCNAYEIGEEITIEEGSVIMMPFRVYSVEK